MDDAAIMEPEMESRESERPVPPIEELPMHLLGDHPAEQYVRDVLSGKILACRYVKLACARHVRDLETGAERGLYFDRDAAIKRIEFYRFCRHFEGEWAGRVIEPAPFQQFIKWCIYGWKRADGSRRFRRVYEEIARKGGKSTDIATDGNYLAFFDGEAGAQVYTAATKKDQARIIHKASSRMVKASPALRRRINVFRDNLHIEETASKYEPLGQDSNTEDGLNIHGALIDEYHAHPDAGMYNVLRSGMGARRQPLLYVITTAGFKKDGPCYEEREYAVNVLEGVWEDDSYFAIIFTLDKEDIDEDRWQDERLWIKSNPNIGITPKYDDMREQAREAARKVSMRNEFLTKRLNIWTESYTAWIAVDDWDKCNAPVDIEGLRGRRCYGAFDLSTVSDMTAWGLCFPPLVPEDPYQFILRFFVPQEDLDKQYKNRDVLERVKNWIRMGYITATPGNSQDYDFIREQIKEDAAAFDIAEIAYDKHNASQLVTDLQKEDLTLVEFGQNIMSMTAPSKDFETKILQKRLAHGGNPVLRWQISCTEIYTDANGNIKPIKPNRLKSSKRIDGVIVAIMALARAVVHVDSSEVGLEVW